jgi:hypothetical protein
LRGLWDHEESLSPSLLKSGIALLAGFLAALAAFNLINGLIQLFHGQFLAALITVTGGLAVPFAIWLAIRMMADMLILLNRTHDRLEAVAERAGQGSPQASVRAINPDTTPSTARARDDGPVYPAED